MTELAGGELCLPQQVGAARRRRRRRMSGCLLKAGHLIWPFGMADPCFTHLHHQYVFWFQISMYDVLLVDRVYGGGESRPQVVGDVSVLCRIKMLPVVGHVHGLRETLRVRAATANVALTLMKYTHSYII